MKYRSKFEAKLASLLNNYKIRFKYEHTKLDYTVPVRAGTCDDCGGSAVHSNHTYLCDFTIQQGKGKKPLLIEAKGKLTSTERSKILNILKSNRDIWYKLIFQYNNKLNRNSKIRYLDWAWKHNIDARILGEVTKEWLQEYRPILL